MQLHFVGEIMGMRHIGQVNPKFFIYQGLTALTDGVKLSINSVIPESRHSYGTNSQSVGKGSCSNAYNNPTIGNISLIPPSTKNPIRTNIPYRANLL